MTFPVHCNIHVPYHSIVLRCHDGQLELTAATYFASLRDPGMSILTNIGQDGRKVLNAQG